MTSAELSNFKIKSCEPLNQCQEPFIIIPRLCCAFIASLQPFYRRVFLFLGEDHRREKNHLASRHRSEAWFLKDEVKSLHRSMHPYYSLRDVDPSTWRRVDNHTSFKLINECGTSMLILRCISRGRLACFCSSDTILAESSRRRAKDMRFLQRLAVFLINFRRFFAAESPQSDKYSGVVIAALWCLVALHFFCFVLLFWAFCVNIDIFTKISQSIYRTGKQDYKGFPAFLHLIWFVCCFWKHVKTWKVEVFLKSAEKDVGLSEVVKRIVCTVIRAVCAYSDLFPNNMRAYVFFGRESRQCQWRFRVLWTLKQWGMPTDADEAKFA